MTAPEVDVQRIGYHFRHPYHHRGYYGNFHAINNPTAQLDLVTFQ